MLTGRSNPEVELSYPFIYFYGLERRVVIDNQDHEAILREVLRLMKIYGKSASFERYACGLIWFTIFRAARDASIPDCVVTDALKATTRWKDDVLSYCLAYFSQSNKPLPTEFAYVVAERLPNSPRSVVITRQADRFRKLFGHKYSYRFEGGLKPRASKRRRKLEYYAASSTLNAYSVQGLNLGEIPDALGVPSQFESLVQIWRECIAELKSFDRVARASSGTRVTTAIYKALPKELRTEDHPEIDAWFQVSQDFLREDGWTVVPARALAAIKGWTTLNKANCRQLLATADILGFGIEPDAQDYWQDLSFR